MAALLLGVITAAHLDHVLPVSNPIDGVAEQRRAMVEDGEFQEGQHIVLLHHVPPYHHLARCLEAIEHVVVGHDEQPNRNMHWWWYRR